ncbi:hypothetical protein D3C78_1489170 [compost metagenome]
MVDQLPPGVVNVTPDEGEAQADENQLGQLGDSGWFVRQVQVQNACGIHQNPGATEEKQCAEKHDPFPAASAQLAIAKQPA